MNELYLSNENLIKENNYLKLICQNIFLEKNNINNKDYTNYISLQKENELLKKDKESFF